MNLVVTVFSFEDAVVTDVMGVFPDRVSAMSWINDQITEELMLNPGYERSDAEDLVMISPPGDDAQEGFVYQIKELSLPTVVVDEGSNDVEATEQR